MVLKELDFNSVLLCRGCGGLERIDFNSLYFAEGVAVLKKLNLTVSTLGGCSDLARILDFNSFYFLRIWHVLERPDFNSFYFGRKWWS